MDVRHPLKAWIADNSTQARFAGAAGCSQGYLSEILSGKKQPSIDMAAKMSRLTGGSVPIDAFVKPAEAAA